MSSSNLKRKEESMEDLRQEISMDEHKISEEELFERLGTSATQGLSNEVAAQRLIELGPNALTPPPETPEWIKFLLTFTNFFSLLLLAGSFLSFIGYAIDTSTPDNMYIGSVLLFVVIATGIFSYKQERQASDIMKKFKNMLPPETTVVRSGESQTVPASELVVGDIIQLRAGDAVPADIRMLSGRSVQVNNSSLTGEAEPQSRIPEFTHENPLETKNLCFYGTAVERGTLTGCVVLTGDHTVIGRIARVASSSEDAQTPIGREIHRFVLIISAVAGFLGISFLILGLILGQAPIEMLVFTIGIIVANVPEGLLATVTVSLSLTAMRMAEKNVLVKNLESVETLGSTTLIASDKTGTLTQNRMTASHVFYNLDIAQCKTSVVSATFDKEDPTFQALQRIATLCNKTVFEKKDLDLPIIERRCIGDASETALLKFVEPMRSATQFRESNPLVAELPFNSANKFMATIHKQEDTSDARHLLCMKGAPERVLNRCSTMLVNGEELPLDDELKAKVLEGVNTLGRMGERVLGFCDFLLPADDFPVGYEFDVDKINFPLEGFRFIGLISLIDPPRSSVPEAVAKCQRAGIRVMMVTGDYPVTAAAIAKQVGILTEPTAEDIAFRDGIDVKDVDTSNVNSIVVHGSQIPDFTVEDWDRVLDHQEVVFARTSPQQKLLIVENNQRRGAIVAVTGDGVNDSPALKKADIGVAMGISGSDVSKEAANMILLDDNFSSIVKGVEEGRLIFDNLKKSIAYTLSSNIPEITPFLAFIVTGMPPALSTVLILAVDLGTDMIPAISLAYETAESDIMRRPPRTASDNLVTTKLISFSYLQIGVIQALAGFFTYFVVWATHGVGPWALPGNGVKDVWDAEETMLVGLGHQQRANILAQAQTAFFISIIVVQYADLLICKTRKLSITQQGMSNRMLSFGLLSETLLGLFVVYVPFMNTVLGTRALKFVHFLPGFPWSILIFSYDEIRKAIIRKNPNGWIARNTSW